MRKKTTRAQHREVGRPPTGKTQYCIRMTPTAHSTLLRAAKAAGHAKLGDWLSNFALSDLSGDSPSFDDMSPVELDTAFRNACDHAAKALSQLYEVVDHDPPVTKRSLKAFQAMKRQYDNVIRLARGVGIRD